MEGDPCLRGDANAPREGLLLLWTWPLEGVFPSCSITCPLFTKVGVQLLSVDEECENSHTDGWSRKLREGQRENKGISCDESVVSGKQFQKPPQSPAPAGVLYFVLKENVADEALSHT